MSDVLRRAHAWIVGDDTGLSSKHLWAVMLGSEPAHPYYPSDPADLGRCLRLLRAIPEWKPRIGEMASQGKAWAALVAHWHDLEASYTREVGGLDPDAGTRAPETYRAMKRLLRCVEGGEP